MSLPDRKLIKDVFEGLLGRDVAVSDGSPVTLDPPRPVVAAYVDPQHNLATVAVMDLPEGGRRVMGYAVAEPRRNCLHWLFVKQAYRRLGVAKSLVAEVTKDFDPSTPRYYSHRTRVSHKLLRERDGWEWDPVLARVRPNV